MKYILLPVMLLLASGAAVQARPRDDVMATLYHCNGLDGDRQWLDCYFGAAQPARAALALKSALPDQIRLAQLPPVRSVSKPSEARRRVIAAAGNCYGENGDRDWLDCYYHAAQSIRENLALATGVLPSQPASDNFGATRPIDTALVNRIVSRMAAYSFDPHHIFTVTLANGQIWRQIEGDTDAARWKEPATAYLVMVRRGMSGSFMLTVRDEPHSFRVCRIR